MDKLKEAIQYCLGATQSNLSSYNERLLTGDVQYMMIPVSGNVFEIPVCAINKFPFNTDGSDIKNVDMITLLLKDKHIKPSYISLNSCICEALKTSFINNRLMKLPSKKTTDPVFYGTYGAIFDKDFIPVVMLSWKIERVISEENDTINYKCVEPILRVSPKVFINKDNAVERYIINKIIPAALKINSIIPSYRTPLSSYHAYNSIKVVIEQCPFSIKKVDAPSIVTTNEELLNVALNHLDEVIQ